MAAPGAAALAHSASRMASTSALLAPGSEQLVVPLGGAGLIVVRDPAVYVRKSESVAERGPIRRTVKVAVLEHRNGLSFPVYPAEKPD